MDRADIVHLLSDACTKRQTSVFFVNAKLEVRDENGVHSQYVPVKYKMCRNGTGEVEAAAAFEALDTEYDDLKPFLKTPEDRLLSIVSSSSDNAPAAKKVSTLLKEKKDLVLEQLTVLYGADHERLAGVVKDLHALTCTNHTNNFTGVAWWEDKGKRFLIHAVARDNAAMLIQGVWSARKRHRPAVRLRGVPRPYVDGAPAGRHYVSDYERDVARVRSGLTLMTAATVDDFGGAAGGGIHDVGNIVRCCSKTFAEGGDNFEYFLNESKQFETFKEETIRVAVAAGEEAPEFDDLRLPPVKGSRALIHGSLCFKIGLNLRSYNQYLLKHSAQTKVDDSDKTKEANKLIKTLLHGLRDKYTVAHILYAGLYTACIADPLVFIMNHLVDRPETYAVWTITAAVLRTITVPAGPDRGRNRWHRGWRAIHPEAETLLRSAVLVAYPQWTARYDLWEVRTGRLPLVSKFMAQCRHPNRAHIIAEYATTGWRRSHDKILLHRGLDCRGIDVLKNAPVNTDQTEGGIGHLDYCLHRPLANFKTCFGSCGAQMMQIFSTQAAQVDRVNKKRKRADHVQFTRQWSMTSYYAIPKARRWEILGIISKGYAKELKIRPRDDAKIQRVDSFRTGLRGRDKWLGLQMKRLINFRRFKSLRLYLHADREAFKAMWLTAGGTTGEGIGEKNRFAGDQIRLRMYCYGVSATDLPPLKVASGSSGAKAQPPRLPHHHDLPFFIMNTTMTSVSS